MNIIVAITKNRGIGKDNKLLVPLHKDLRNFKELTLNNIVIYGRKTLETFPNKKPLKDRINIVLTHSPENIEDALTMNSITELLKNIKCLGTECVFVIGGESIYKELLPYCDTLYVTEIDLEVEADRFFPEFKDDFVEVKRIDDEEDGVKFSFVTYKRRT